MRTTIDIPDELYRSLKARAALGGEPLRDIVTRLIHLGLRADPSATASRASRRGAPPVAIPPAGVAIPALSHMDRVRAEEAEDEAKLARSA